MSVTPARGGLLVLLNAAFFGGILVVVLVSGFLFPSLPYEGLSLPFQQMTDAGFPLLFVSIFVMNLVLSAFFVVTLSGLVFFPLSTGFLVYRATLWGLLLHSQPTWVCMVALPTIVLEGEGYVLAAVAGTVLGVSWVKPRWIYGGWSLGRKKSLRKAVGECLRMYVLVALFLLVAAAVESTTLALIPR